MLHVSELYIYPVKSLAGIAVTTATMTSRGFKNDRRMMLVDENNKCLTQRDLPEMALLEPSIGDDGLYIRHKNNFTTSLVIPHQPEGSDVTDVSIWNDTCVGQVYDEYINQWFSDVLKTSCKLVFMPDTSRRQVDKRYAKNNEVTSFADEYPTLIIGQASLDELNTRLEIPVPINRFRPNIVFTGGKAFLEDELDEFAIGTISFTAVKPCARCMIITIHQDTTEKSSEPTRTLATYRQRDNKILFGQNLLHMGSGSIAIGDSIEVKSSKPPPMLLTN